MSAQEATAPDHTRALSLERWNKMLGFVLFGTKGDKRGQIIPETMDEWMT